MQGCCTYQNKIDTQIVNCRARTMYFPESVCTTQFHDHKRYYKNLLQTAIPRMHETSRWKARLRLFMLQEAISDLKVNELIIPQLLLCTTCMSI